MKQRLVSPLGLSLSLSIAVFAFYLKTLAPTVTFIDSGELAAVSCTLGIAHPTGYPLFTLLGWLFSQLPIAGEEIGRLNIMAAFFSAAGIFFFCFLMQEVLALVVRSFGRGLQKGISPTIITLMCCGSGLMLAFSRTVWSQALSVEVYSLHFLFLSLILYTCLKALTTIEKDESSVVGPRQWWLLFGFLVGLAFTNHMSAIMLAPGLIYLYFATQGGGERAWKRLRDMGLPFLIGLSVYIYLPLRAAQVPEFNWGNPVTLERFIWHLSAKQFRVWLFSSTEVAVKHLQYFFSSLPAEFAMVGLFFSFVGAITLWRAHRKLAIASILLFLMCILYAASYDIHDIDTYFLLSYVCIALWAGCGMLALYVWAAKRSTLLRFLLVGVIIVACVAPGAVNYRVVDESENYLVEDYTRNMFRSLEPNSLILSSQWDFWVSASYYYQFVKGVRSDVVVVDKELLRRSWYLLELENRHPWLIDRSRKEVGAFGVELEKFERNRPYDPRVIQARFVGMIESFIRTTMKERPVYVTSDVEAEFTRGLQRVPEGLAFRLYADTSFHSPRGVEYARRPFDRSGRLEDMMRRLYAHSVTSRGIYYYRFGRGEDARIAFKTAVEMDPSLPEPRQWLRMLESSQN